MCCGRVALGGGLLPRSSSRDQTKTRGRCNDQSKNARHTGGRRRCTRRLCQDYGACKRRCGVGQDRDRCKSIFNNNLSYSGELEAYSLKLQIIDDTGKVLFQGMGGVALTKHLEDGHPVPVPEPFANAASGDAGVAVALRALR